MFFLRPCSECERGDDFWQKERIQRRRISSFVKAWAAEQFDAASVFPVLPVGPAATREILKCPKCIARSHKKASDASHSLVWGECLEATPPPPEIDTGPIGKPEIPTEDPSDDEQPPEEAPDEDPSDQIELRKQPSVRSVFKTFGIPHCGSIQMRAWPCRSVQKLPPMVDQTRLSIQMITLVFPLMWTPLPTSLW